MKIVFIGASKLGLKCLEKIYAIDGCEVVGVVTLEERFSISYSPNGVKNYLHGSVSEYCSNKLIPHHIMKNGMNSHELIQKVKGWGPDAFIVVGWYHLLPSSWLDIAPAYGLHASLLPDYSGGAPLVWAIINGESETGISFFQFKNGVDNGPIIGQEKTLIEYEDTIKTVYERINDLAVKLVEKNLPQMIKGELVLAEQNEEKRRIFPQRKPDDGEIDWVKTSAELYNFIRAQTKPYPGAFFWFEGHKITVWKAAEADQIFNKLEPGSLTVQNGNLYISCAEGQSILLQEIAIDGVDIELNEFLVRFSL